MKNNYEIEEGLLKYILEITDVDYTGKLELKDIENIIKDLICEYHKLEEKLEDQKKYCEEWHETKKLKYED